MNTKALCIIILVLTAAIFWGNHSAASNEPPDESCPSCQCTVTMVTVKDPKAKEEPSCSAVFSKGQFMNLKITKPTVQKLYTHYPEDNHYDLIACNPVIYCDKTAEVKLECKRSAIDGDAGIEKRVISYGQKCPIFCEYRGGTKIPGTDVWLTFPDKVVRSNCDHWERPAPSGSKPRLKKPGTGMLSSMFLEASWQGSSTLASFAPAIYSDQATDDRRAKEVISGSTRWRIIEGEAGIDHGMLMVSKGEAEARSFCTGDTVRLTGPSLISLPTCQPDFSGQWQGNYARRLADGKLTPVEVSLNLRKESGSVRGEVTTSDGTFNIVEAYQSGSLINLQAERTVAGTPVKLSLNGALSKGEIAFGGREQLPGAAVYYNLNGFVRRLYIADSALPTAILNQPYSFPLTAFAPEGQALTFRLATPAITKPEQITWNAYAKDLRGRNGERFTYSCPANNPSISPSAYGTDVYTDDSSICLAALHSGLIRQAGGVVTIEIKPDAGSYTGSTRNGVSSKSYGAYKGSYVFVRVEANVGERGRLPRGLSFDTKSGIFSGTPTEPGSFDISVVADDGAGNLFEQALTLNVKKLAVTSGLLPDGIVGQPYAATLTAAGGQGPYRFSGTMPAGLQLDPVTGEVRGTPSSPSAGYDRYGNRGLTTGFEVTIRDSQDSSESQKVSLIVRETTIMNSHFLPDAKLGVPYRTQFHAVGNLTLINYWGMDQKGPMPTGLSLNERTGELSGTPTRAGDFSIEVTAEVGSGATSRQFALTVR
jgi:LCCL domain/Putative Ig domain